MGLLGGPDFGNEAVGRRMMLVEVGANGFASGALLAAVGPWRRDDGEARGGGCDEGWQEGGFSVDEDAAGMGDGVFEEG